MQEQQRRPPCRSALRFGVGREKKTIVIRGIEIHFLVFLSFSLLSENTRHGSSLSLSLSLSATSMASPIPSELLPALDALYAAPTGVSSPGTSDDAEQRRRAAERWLVAFQASDAAWQVRDVAIRSYHDPDGVFNVSSCSLQHRIYWKRRAERGNWASENSRCDAMDKDDERGAPWIFTQPLQNLFLSSNTRPRSPSSPRLLRLRRTPAPSPRRPCARSRP